MLEALKQESSSLGKAAWRPMLRYAAELHERATHPPAGPLREAWEDTGPGYCYGPAFGHWDIVHAVLDVLPAEPDHARRQIRNALALQREDGMLPAIVWFRPEGVRTEYEQSHPPVWPAAVDAWTEATGSQELLETALEAASRQLAWFGAHRRAPDGGFYYQDITTGRWESGVDEGVRFEARPVEPFALADSTSHVWLLADAAARWAQALGRDGRLFAEKAEAIAAFVRDRLFDDETGFFRDAAAVGRADAAPLGFEGMWPLAVGAAAEDQAARAIEENLLAPERFFTAHPIATVARSDPRFDLRMWRGPAWNSMTHWAARGCVRYGRPDAARRLLEAALDASAREFRRTGTIWEFYHPDGGRPEDLERKPGRPQKGPSRDYLGHNPLLAMARLWRATAKE